MSEENVMWKRTGKDVYSFNYKKAEQSTSSWHAFETKSTDNQREKEKVDININSNCLFLQIPWIFFLFSFSNCGGLKTPGWTAMIGNIEA